MYPVLIKAHTVGSPPSLQFATKLPQRIGAHILHKRFVASSFMISPLDEGDQIWGPEITHFTCPFQIMSIASLTYFDALDSSFINHQNIFKFLIIFGKR